MADLFGTPAVTAIRRTSGWAKSALRGAAILLACTAAFTALAQDSAGLDKWLAETEQALAKVEDYTAVFHRVERVDGKLIPEQITIFKFKRPFRVYMKWITPSKGQQSLFVRGANEDRIRARGGGLAGLVTVNLSPTGNRAMHNARHPITEAGLHNLLERIAGNLRKGLQAGELVSIDHGEKVVYGRKTRELEGVLSRDPAKGYYCYRCVVNLDLETKVPIRTRVFDWEDRLVEDYGYENLKLNPGLTDRDFDHKNPEYGF